jgi:hypothetical protein
MDFNLNKLFEKICDNVPRHSRKRRRVCVILYQMTDKSADNFELSALSFELAPPAPNPEPEA